MKKYLSIFKISLQQELVYHSKFVIDRLRNILQIFLIFFLWDSVFADPTRVVFGYDRAKILTYVFGLLILKAIVSSSKAADISGIVSSGDLANYLLKPVNFVRYWFSRDISTKAINTLFALIEGSLLYFILRPPFFLQGNFFLILSFLISLSLAIILFFAMLTLVSFIPFWLPEQTWPPVFLFLTIAELLSGAIFPLDIFPEVVQSILYLLPFPYLLFIPLQLYLGKLSTVLVIKSLIVAFAWVGILGLILEKVWKMGLVQFRAEGR